MKMAKKDAFRASAKGLLDLYSKSSLNGGQNLAPEPPIPVGFFIPLSITIKEQAKRWPRPTVVDIVQ